MGETEIQISNIEKNIGEIKGQLREMSSALGKIAVQKERLDNLTDRVDAIWKKYDDIVVPVLQSCPKTQVKWLWYIVLPMGITQLTMAAGVLKMLVGG